MRRLRFALALVPVVLSACGAAVTADPVASQPSTVPGSASPPPTASAVESGGGQPSPTALAGDPLHGLVLRDVRDGTEFTLGQLAADKPVLLEAMAIWCTNCRAQMHRVVEAHRMVDFHSVGVDVDPSELAGDLKAYVEAQGFDWPFVMADAELATLLRQHDSGFLFPPNTPMLLLLPDGSVRPLDFGGYSVDELVAEISGG